MDDDKPASYTFTGNGLLPNTITLSGALHSPVPLLINDEDGTTIFQLSRDGSIEIDWKRVEAKAAEWTHDSYHCTVITCKMLVEVAKRVKAETEASFLP